MNSVAGKMSTQVETRLPSARPRRSLLPGPKAHTLPKTEVVRSVNLPSPTSPSSGFKHLLLGQEVTTSDGRIGILRFKGKTHFTQGYLCGIELYHDTGKNDGSVDGIHYFECAETRGLFVPAYKVFPSGPPSLGHLNGQSKTSKSSGQDTKAQKKFQTTTVGTKRLPRPKTLPFTEGTFQKERKYKSSKSGAGQIDCYTVKVSCSSKTKDRQATSSKLLNRKVSPLHTSVTCPAWLGKDAPKSPNSRFSHISLKEKTLNNTFTVPGDDNSDLQSSYSARRKCTKTVKIRNGYQQRRGTPEEEDYGRLESVPSYQNLSSITGSDEELDTPTKPDILEDCQSRVNRTYDMTKDRVDSYAPPCSSVTFELGSQGSLGTWEENSVSCEKSNSSLAWDFDIPTTSTPVEFHVRVATDHKSQLSDDTEDFVSTDEEVEYNEFLAIPSFYDTPTGRCKFDLLTPEELEQALNESNLLPDELRGGFQEDEPLLNLSNFENTPIWEPITPVEEEFLPFSAGSTLDPNPLAFWSMDSVPQKSEGTSYQDQDQPQNIEGSVEMEFTTSTAYSLENGVSPVSNETFEVSKVTTNEHDKTQDVKTLKEDDGSHVVQSNGLGPHHGAGLSPVDLLEGVDDGLVTDVTLQNGNDNDFSKETDVKDTKRDGEPPVTVELTINTNSQPAEFSDSSSCSNRTVTENLNALERVVGDVTMDLKQSMKVQETSLVNGDQTEKGDEEKDPESKPQGPKKRSLLIKPKTGVKPITNTKPKPESNIIKEKGKTVKTDSKPSQNNKPPVPPKTSVIPRRKTLEPGKASVKLTEVKSRINTGRRSVDSNMMISPADGETVSQKLKSKETISKKEVKVTKRTPTFQLRTEKDRVRKPSSSSVTSENSRGRADSRGSVNSSRPSSKSDVSTEAKRSSRKITNPPLRNVSNVSNARKSTRSSLVTPPTGKPPPVKEKTQKSNVTNVDAAPTRRAGFAIPASRKPSSTADGTKINRKPILSKDPKQAKIKKLKSGSSTPPDVVYTSIPDVRTNEEVKRLEALCETQTKQLDTACQQIKVNAKAFETMAVLVQFLTQECDAFAVPALKEKINHLEEQVKETSQQISVQEKEIIKLGEELTEAKKYHEKEIVSLKECHERETEAVKKDMAEKHEAELESLKQNHVDELAKESDRYKKMEEEATSLQNKLHQQDLEHLEYVSRMQREQEQQKIEEECRHEQAIAKIKGEAKLREQVLQDENYTLTFKCENLQEKITMLEDALQKDSDAKVQAAVAQFKHLPEEVESLKTVLGMKNQEIQDMRIKILDLEKEVATIPEKNDKIKRLEAKVEDLNALVETKIVYERQLSSEQVALRENFERETNANKRLSMENEELMWKLNQSGAMSPGRLTPPRFNPSPVPSSPLTSRTLLIRASSSESHESGVFSPNNPQH